MLLQGERALSSCEEHASADPAGSESRGALHLADRLPDPGSSTCRATYSDLSKLFRLLLGFTSLCCATPHKPQPPLLTSGALISQWVVLSIHFHSTTLISLQYRLIAPQCVQACDPLLPSAPSRMD